MVSISMADEWSHLIPNPSRSEFLEACREAQPDEERLQAVLRRYFSTWKTSLMADDLTRLQRLIACVRIRELVKVICVEDDCDESEEMASSESAMVWPRHEDGKVAAEALGVEALQSMLATEQLRLERLEIRDTRTSRTPSDPETAALLARDILKDARPAITSLSVRKDSPMTTIIAAELSPEHQDQGTGLSMLCKAELCLGQDLNSYWAQQVLFHAPALKELSLSFWRPDGMRHTSPLVPEGSLLPELEKLDLSTAMLSIESIMAILSKSKQSLAGISFRLTTLIDNSTWPALLTRIGHEFPHLEWFKFRALSEGPIGQSPVTFPGLDMDSVVGEPYRSGLQLLQKGPAGKRRISGVEYRGPDANHVLGIVAECATTASPPK